MLLLFVIEVGVEKKIEQYYLVPLCNRILKGNMHNDTTIQRSYAAIIK